MSSNSPWSVLTAEWTKIRALRSTVITLALAFVLSVGFGVLSGVLLSRAIDRRDMTLRSAFEPLDASFAGLQFGQLSLVAFGVLLFCSEHNSGMIRASLAAVPQRGLFYLGKLAAGASVAFAFSTLSAFGSFFAVQAALGEYGVSLSHGEALRTVVGASLYLTLICLFAVGVGALLRRTALSQTVMFLFIFILSPLASSIDSLRDVARYLPDNAGARVMRVGSEAAVGIGPWTGLLVLAAWTVVALLAGYAVLRRRDA